MSCVKLQSLSLDYFNRSTMGDLLQRINGDTAALNRCLGVGFLDSIKEPFSMIGIIIALCAIDWKLTALRPRADAALPDSRVQKLGRRAREAAGEGIKSMIAQNSLLVENLNGIRVVKALNLEDAQANRFRDHSRELIKAMLKSVQAREQINPIIETFSMLGLGLLVLYIFFNQPHHAGHGRIPYRHDVLLHSGQETRLAPHPVAGIENRGRSSRRDPDGTTDRRGAPRRAIASDFSSGITFHGVHFAYDEQQPVLQGIDLNIPRGAKIGIAGENGSGKSTLVNLLLRFYDPTEGKITIDGIDLRDVRVSDLRNLIGLVSQDVVIFDQSIAGNIGCAKPGATQEEIEARREGSRLPRIHYRIPGRLRDAGRRAWRAVIRRTKTTRLDRARIHPRRTDHYSR